MSANKCNISTENIENIGTPEHPSHLFILEVNEKTEQEKIKVKGKIQ